MIEIHLEVVVVGLSVQLWDEKWQIAKYSVIGMLCPDLRTSFSDEVSLKVA